MSFRWSTHNAPVTGSSAVRASPCGLCQHRLEQLGRPEDRAVGEHHVIAHRGSFTGLSSGVRGSPHRWGVDVSSVPLIASVNIGRRWIPPSRFVESKWFVGIVAGKPATGIRWMDIDAATSLRSLRDAYRGACTISDSIITAIGDADAPVAHDGPVHNLRGALLAVIDETARHAGHADMIRERLNGATTGQVTGGRRRRRTRPPSRRRRPRADLSRRLHGRLLPNFA